MNKDLCHRKWISRSNRKSKIETPKLVWLVALAIAFVTGRAEVQAQQAKISRIGLLGGASASANTGRIEAFRQGLRDLGYVEGKSIIIEQRWADGQLDRLPSLAAELLQLKSDIIVSAGPTVTRAAKKAVTIPIVMSFDDDPVGSGFVASLARPGGNITGLSSLSPELSGKQLELLKEIIPRLSRVAVLGSLTHPGTAQSLKEIELAAEAFKLQHQYLDVREPTDIATAFGAASKGRVDALVVLTSVVTNSHRQQIVELTLKHRLPAIYYTAEWVEAGGLMTYGASFTDLFRRAATYVDRILKGAKPAELPVEQPKKFEFTVNLKAAKLIGLTIPQKVLARADKVIK
jgi:putative tryptophan/tyrosine transport system substrate-binding protein